jgi:hypothetical protein
MTPKARLELGALSALMVLTCRAPAACGQTAGGDSSARPVILTLSYGHTQGHMPASICQWCVLPN